jgi:Flp pilus assembly protein TadD
VWIAAMAVTPAFAANTPVPAGFPLKAYARARAADSDGQVTVAARGYGQALAAQPADPLIAVRALREGLASGDMVLARRAGAVLHAADLAPPDIELLAFADALVARDAAGQRAALARLEETPIAFLGPMTAAWTDGAAPAAATNGGPIVRRYGAENAALLLLAQRKLSEGITAVRALLASDGSDFDLRLNAAQLLARAGQKESARSLLAGDDPVLRRAAASLGKGRKGDARFGVSRLFGRMAGDLSAAGTEPLAILLTRAALVLDPGYGRARLALADALARDGATAQALTELAAIPVNDPFAAGATGLRATILQRSGDATQAIAVAREQAEAPGASVVALRRYADMLVEAQRPAEAAAIYATALDRAGSSADWTLYLQRGGALDQAGDWDAALPMLRRAVELAPDQPGALNYLGYALVDRGQEVAAATRMLERAHALAPKDAAIADSLGWARFKQGNIATALPLIEGAARTAPTDVEINEHLGDIYWAAGRRFEARYAWRAAALTATGQDATRLATKLANGPASSQR